MVVIATGGVSPARAGQHTIDPASPWQARRRGLVTGLQHALLLGVFVGHLCVEKGSKVP
jgi:hypothetical protein